MKSLQSRFQAAAPRLGVSVVEVSERVGTLLQSNAPPLDSEAAHIRMLKSTLARERSSTHQEIVAKQEKLGQLQQLEETLDICIEGMGVITSAIRRFPDGVLAEMLSHTFPSEKPSQSSRVDVRTGPWMPALVCKRWRKICLANPNWWTKISARIGSSEGCSSSTLDVLLSRSASLPLDVSLTIEDGHMSSNHPLVASLIPSTARWKSLTLTIDCSSSILSLTSLLQTIPLLETIAVEGAKKEKRSDIESEAELIDWPSCFSEICHFTSTNFVSPAVQFQQAPWHLLRSLSITNEKELDLNPVLYVLNEMKLLEILCIEADGLASYEAAPQQDPVTFPDLTSIRLLGDPTMITRVLDRLTVPKLTEVTFTVIPQNVRALKATIGRSSCSVKILRIESHEVPWRPREFYGDFFSVLRDVHTVVIDEETFDNATSGVFKGLSISESHNYFPLPKLKRLDVRAYPAWEGNLVDLLVSRSKPLTRSLSDDEVEAISRLEDVRCYFRFPSSPDLHKKSLDDCRANGMCITNTIMKFRKPLKADRRWIH